MEQQDGSRGARSDDRQASAWVGRRRTLRETADALGVEAVARDGVERALGGGVPTRVVRGEDDFVITADGALCLSSGLPRGADEVEAWMAALR